MRDKRQGSGTCRANDRARVSKGPTKLAAVQSIGLAEMRKMSHHRLIDSKNCAIQVGEEIFVPYRRGYKFNQVVVDGAKSGWRMVGGRFYRDMG